MAARPRGRVLRQCLPLLLPLLLVALLLLAPQLPAPTAVTASAGPAPMAEAEGAGVALRLRVPPGPYFAGELLQVHRLASPRRIPAGNLCTDPGPRRPGFAPTVSPPRHG